MRLYSLCTRTSERDDGHFAFCSHYFVNGGWFEDDNHLLSRVDTIRHIPATIVQGRYDMITPMKTAWELHKVGPNLAVEMRLSLSATYCHANSRTHTHTHTPCFSCGQRQNSMWYQMLDTRSLSLGH